MHYGCKIPALNVSVTSEYSNYIIQNQIISWSKIFYSNLTGSKLVSCLILLTVTWEPSKANILHILQNAHYK